jgi:DNA (cytosine-5)-methyltransferase 1
MEKLRVIELFAGIGAWSTALKNLKIDHEVVLAVEKDKHPLTAYNAIHNTEFKPIDIYKLNKYDVPDCDVVFYSPQCQAFSFAGAKEGFNDSKGRGLDFFEALKIIKHKQPQFAVMENVKALAGNKFKNEFNIMLKHLEDAGYNNYWKVLNGIDYGMAQNRERVFIVSVRNDIKKVFEFPNQKKLNTRIKDYLSDDVEKDLFFNDVRTKKLLSTMKTNIIPSKNGIIQVNNPKHSQQRVYDPNGVAPTLAAGNLGGGKEPCKIHINGMVRKISPLEMWRLMGFTDESYYIAKNELNNTYYNGKDKSKTKLYKMAGNSIIVNVVENLLINLHIQKEINL